MFSSTTQVRIHKLQSKPSKKSEHRLSVTWCFICDCLLTRHHIFWNDTLPDRNLFNNVQTMQVLFIEVNFFFIFCRCLILTTTKISTLFHFFIFYFCRMGRSMVPRVKDTNPPWYVKDHFTGF